MERRFGPSGPLRGLLVPPPDKSISHRAALIAAMGEGETVIDRYLHAADTRSTLGAVQTVGATLQVEQAKFRHPPPLIDAAKLSVTVRGVGLRGARNSAVDVGNAGTLLRIMPGWLAGQPGGEWTLDGDESIRRRPVDRVAEPLALMGAEVECRDGRLPPLRVHGAELNGIEYGLPVASAQVKSSILLAGLLADGKTTVVEPTPTRDHTERMLRTAGVEVKSQDGRIEVGATEALSLGEFEVPGDFSSAAFIFVAALLVPGSEVELSDVGLNPTRTGLLTILERMGAQLEVESSVSLTSPGFEEWLEDRGRVRSRHRPLTGTEVRGAEVPLAIDELPLVALAGCFAEGETVIREAGELRTKESDRIATVCKGLSAIGGDVEPTEDGMVIQGIGGLRGGTLDAGGDHRLAMLGAVAGLASREGVTVRGFEAAEVSYPEFDLYVESLLGR